VVNSPGQVLWGKSRPLQAAAHRWQHYARTDKKEREIK